MARKSKKRERPRRRPCRTCGEVFQPRRKGQESCSDYCRNLFWRKKHRSIRIALESIDDHEARLKAIENRLRIKKGAGP